MTGENMLEMAKQAVRLGQKKGAQEVAVNTRRTREVSVSWRDGNLEKLHEATTAALSLQLYVDGRYSAVSTSDLRPEALEKFIENAISLARSLAPDPYRSLPDPQTYKGQADIDLQLEDASYDSLSAVQRRKIAQSMEEAARAVDGAQAILSVTTQVADSQSQHFKVHSNGFEGTTRETSFWLAAEASVQDPDGRRPEDYDFAGSRFFKQLPDSSTIGRQAAQRALQRIGAQKGSSAVVPVAIDYRAGGRIFSYLIGPLSAASLQQKRSMFEGKLETTIGSPLLSVHDDPLIPKAFGSYLFDGEGMAAKRLAIFESGVLKNYYVDCYYGKKLKMTPHYWPFIEFNLEAWLPKSFQTLFANERRYFNYWFSWRKLQ